MADISKSLEDIKNAVFGEEVRSSIVDAIEAMNEEASMVNEINEASFYVKSAMPYEREGKINLKDIIETGMYALDSSWNLLDSPDTSRKWTALFVFNFSDLKKKKWVIQVLTTILNGPNDIYVRHLGTMDVWTNWELINNRYIQNYTGISESSSFSSAFEYNHLPFPKSITGTDPLDLNDLVTNGNYLVSTTVPMSNYPPQFRSQPYFVRVYNYSLNNTSNFTEQYASRVFSNTAYTCYRIRVANGTWTDWVEITGGSNNNPVGPTEYNIVQNNVTHNISSTVEAISDNSYFLESTGDSSDRTDEILSLLSLTGVCRLGAGKFYVKNLDMPVNSSLIGCGRSTELVMNPNGLSSGDYVVKLNHYTTVKSLCIKGTLKNVAEAKEYSHDYVGLLFQGILDDSGAVIKNTIQAMVDDVYISGIDGSGVKCLNTGQAINASCMFTNLYTEYCGIGVNIERSSEYLQFTNCKFCRGSIACINNGGNNVFTNCHFIGCDEGFIMDDPQNNMPNDSHGTCSCCSFTHIGPSNSERNDAIRIVGMHNGFVFNGCQLFYGNINIKNSSGIVFNSLNMGSIDTITSTNSKAIIFDNCITSNVPEISGIGMVFTNCYNRSNGAKWGE